MSEEEALDTYHASQKRFRAAQREWDVALRGRNQADAIMLRWRNAPPRATTWDRRAVAMLCQRWARAERELADARHNYAKSCAEMIHHANAALK